jgi:hypothetical protein
MTKIAKSLDEEKTVQMLILGTENKEVVLMKHTGN